MAWVKAGWLLLGCVLVGCAGRSPYRKLPEVERPLIEAVDLFLEPEQVEAYLEAPDARSRQALLDQWGVAEKYLALSDEQRAAVDEGVALPGMSKDAVAMALGTPLRIRRQYESAIEEYVETYIYRYERTRKGEVFPSPPNSRSAYKNDVFERRVEFVRGEVRAVVEVDVH